MNIFETIRVCYLKRYQSDKAMPETWDAEWVFLQTAKCVPFGLSKGPLWEKKVTEESGKNLLNVLWAY